MKSMLKRAASAILVVAIALTTVLAVPTAEVEAASVSYPKTMTVYLQDKSGTSSGYTEGDTIKVKTTKKVKNAKSSKKSVLKLEGTDKFKKYSLISFYAKKAGTSKVTYKVGSKTYTTKVTVKNYTNPAKTIMISGVKSGKNIASKFKKANEDDTFKISTTTNKAKLTVQAAKGWKLTEAVFRDEDTGKNLVEKTYSKGTSKKKTYSLGKLTKGHTCWAALTFKNTKTSGTQTIYVGMY